MCVCVWCQSVSVCLCARCPITCADLRDITPTPLVPAQSVNPCHDQDPLCEAALSLEVREGEDTATAAESVGVGGGGGVFSEMPVLIHHYA